MKFLIQIVFTFLFLNCIGETVIVKRIIDGDTFETETGSKVRLIGINAPELSDIFGVESKEYLSSLILGKQIELQKDNLSKNTDQYSRLLRYVFIHGTDINLKLISDGYAFAYLKFNFQKKDSYRQAQLYASNCHVGIWSQNRNKECKTNYETDFMKIETIPMKYFLLSGLILILLILGGLTFTKK